EQEGEEGETAVAEPTPDPARLPDLLIQGMAQAGLELEYAQDISPEMMRLLAGFGPQAIQALALLTPDNLRLLQPEVIALLPVAFLDTLDADLRAELDTLAAEFGGAGALAIAEAEETAAASAEAPALAGIWVEPGPNGEEPLFKTAYDLINNGFMPGAAVLLNFLPSSPNGDMAPQMMADLTPDVIAYLAENEEGFIENLEPNILELMSPETILFMLANYPDAFDADLTARLEGVAAGTVTVFVPDAAITRTDGNPSVLIQVFKGGDDNTVDTAHAIFDTMAEFEQAHPGMKATLVFEQATFIEESIAGVTREGSLGAVFAVLVILVFLSGHIGGRYRLSWRATLVIAVSIPLSIFSAFFLMQWLPVTIGEGMQNWANSSGSSVVTFISRLFPNSVTLNIMTLSGLTVAIGRVVDDSIVVLENSYRHIQRGEETNDAIRAATREVAIAIFSATVTTMVVFLPLGFVGGIIGS
ncbi:MAG TPA: efflux RND transporter permease subunit, partial [Chloroflexota bacterium]|nr:efflux RND transporter permease subunit [Chloroflexota bacterium]